MGMWSHRIQYNMEHQQQTELRDCGESGLRHFFNLNLLNLLDLGLYNREDNNNRNMLAYVYIPIVQKEIDTFMELWNSLRCRLQKNTLMPDGIPDFIYSNPEAYDLEDKGWELSLDELENVAGVSGVLDAENDYLTDEFRGECSHIILHPESILPQDPSKHATSF